MIDGASHGGRGGSSAHRVHTRSHTNTLLVAQSFMMGAVDKRDVLLVKSTFEYTSFHANHKIQARADRQSSPMLLPYFTTSNIFHE